MRGPAVWKDTSIKNKAKMNGVVISTDAFVQITLAVLCYICKSRTNHHPREWNEAEEIQRGGGEIVMDMEIEMELTKEEEKEK